MIIIIIILAIVSVICLFLIYLVNRLPRKILAGVESSLFRYPPEIICKPHIWP